MRSLFILLFPFSLLSGVHTKDTEVVKKHVHFLSSIQPARNHRNQKSLQKVLSYIRKEIQPYAPSVRLQEYPVRNQKYANLIANIGPVDAETIVIGAHYDVCGDQPGADDNASGVAGLLLLAKYLSENRAALRYNYELVFYSLEEPPYFRTEYMGSAVHARSLREKGARVKYMLSLETIGYYSDAKDSQSYPAGLGWFYPSEGNFIAAVGRMADGNLLSRFKADFQKNSSLKIITLAAPSFVTGIDFSDHLNYWAMGWNAAMITDTALMRNHNYHEVTDTPETLDYEKIVQVIGGVFRAVTAP